MQINLPPEVEQILHRKIAAGSYNSPSDAIAMALLALDSWEEYEPNTSTPATSAKPTNKPPTSPPPASTGIPSSPPTNPKNRPGTPSRVHPPISLRGLTARLSRPP